jgi:hypothetical protein
MSEEYENVFRRKELHDMFVEGDIAPLEDMYLIEDAALTIQDLMGKVEFYKEYKKKRIASIADEMKVVQNKIDFFKQIISETLKANKERSVKFPGSCSVSSRSQKSKWQINDEEEFIVVLQAAKEAGENIDDVLEEVVQFNIRKREADKLISRWESSGKLSEFLKEAKSEDIIEKIPQKTTIALSFDKKQEEEPEVEEMVIPKKKTSNIKTSDDDYDIL